MSSNIHASTIQLQKQFARFRNNVHRASLAIATRPTELQNGQFFQSKMDRPQYWFSLEWLIGGIVGRDNGIRLSSTEHMRYCGISQTTYQNRFNALLKSLVKLLGPKVVCKPINPQDGARLRRHGAKMFPGIFMGVTPSMRREDGLVIYEWLIGTKHKTLNRSPTSTLKSSNHQGSR